VDAKKSVGLPLFDRECIMDMNEQMEHIYRNIPLENIPWNMPEPPALLVEAVASGRIKPCRVVDLGCGAGNYSVWLAQHGFDVTGIEISQSAIALAGKLAASKGVSCRFVAADLLGDLREFHSSFDLAFDWEVLHHIQPEDRPGYLQNVRNLLRPDGMYISLCFSDKDIEFSGGQKIFKTPLGTILYFSTEEELEELYKPLFHIIELKTVSVPGKQKPHRTNVAWLRRK